MINKYNKWGHAFFYVRNHNSATWRKHFRDCRSATFSRNVVQQLHIRVDNFFSSPQLFKEILLCNYLSAIAVFLSAISTLCDLKSSYLLNWRIEVPNVYQQVQKVRITWTVTAKQRRLTEVLLYRVQKHSNRWKTAEENDERAVRYRIWTEHMFYL